MIAPWEIQQRTAKLLERVVRLRNEERVDGDFERELWRELS